MLKKQLENLYIESMRLNDQNIIHAITKYGPFTTILDVGCWDGYKTMQYAEAAKSNTIYGIELVDQAAITAMQKGIHVFNCHADKGQWLLDDQTVDCIVSNQVIEHLSFTDVFIKEAARVLKPNGYIITSTNNLSSWHNIFALLMGWAPFDLTNSSTEVSGLGNPLALHKHSRNKLGATWTHKTIYTAKWLNDWFSVYGLKPVTLYGSGYHPLPPVLGKYLRTHSAFITLVHRK